MTLPPDPVPLSASQVQSGLDALHATFLAWLGAKAAARFVPPPALLAYLHAAGGGPYKGRISLSALADMAHLTDAWLSVTADSDEEAAADGPWVYLASFGDKHWLFLCCDIDHPEYGHVAEGYDATPWLSEEDLDYDLRSVLDPWHEEEDDEDERWTLEGLLELLAPRWA